MRSNKTPSPLYRNVIAMAAVAGFVFAFEAYIGNESVWSSLVMPLMHNVDPETAHRISIQLASFGIVPRIAADSKEVESYLVTLIIIVFHSISNMANCTEYSHNGNSI